MIVFKKGMTSLVAGLAIASAAGTATAAPEPQESQASGSLLDEIVVTAQRREERVQDVPIAISAFSADQLEKLNVTETLDMVKLIPNLLGFNNTGLGTANGYYLRGIGNTESIATFDPPVGTYVDDVFLSRQNANNLGLFDVERIEVLRGPQGTLFGRNTTGGAMNVILRAPGEEMGGYVEAGFGEYNQRSFRGTIDLPVSDTVLTKLSVYSIKDDGYVSNPITGEDNINATDTMGVRGSMRELVSDAVTWDLAAQYSQDKGLNILNFARGSGSAYRGGAVANGLVSIPAGGPQVALVPQRAGLPATSSGAQSVEARCLGTVTSDRFTCTGLRQTGTPLANLITGDKRFYNLGNDVESTMITSNIKWQSSVGEFSFITGYVDMSQKFAIDFFNGTGVKTAAGGTQPTNPVGGFVIANDGEHSQFSQEIKLTGEIGEGTRYVAGMYFFDEKNVTDFADLFSLSPTLTLVLEDRILNNRADAMAIYTQWDFTPFEKATLTLGGRYTDETKKVAFTANAAPGIAAAPTAATRVNTANLIAAGIPLELNTALFTPRIAFKYDVSDDMNVFASATRGFKSGGWNARGTAPVANQPFAPETVWSYEFGLRSEWLDRTLRLNLTGFVLDVEDLQTPAGFVAPSGAISFITRNFAGMKNSGVEAELIYAPTENLNLFLFAGSQDAKYQDVSPSILTQQVSCKAAIAGTGGRAGDCNNGIINPSGEIPEPVRAPDTLALGASYSLNIGENLRLTPNVLWAFTGDNNVATNGAPAGLVEAYDTLDAGITLENASGGWRIQANCRNCTDEVQVVSVLSDLAYIQAPRSWNVTFKYDFGARRR
jgi:iron complex outermembrane receptor protein